MDALERLFARSVNKYQHEDYEDMTYYEDGDDQEEDEE